MKVKVSEASGPILDWLAAKCEGVPVHWDSDEDAFIFFDREEGGERNFAPSTDPAQAYPIIERERITTEHRCDSGGWRARIWSDNKDNFIEAGHRGPYCNTPLIAAMRCYVASKLGDEVEVPDEVLRNV